ncbi:MAG: penicillin-binding protein 2 [Anaerolineae bacterium]|jgi:cell division protein FtsI/penicillin-binding protein 2|nr:penicillin-binding protein 2 [Anaerolineae bacterium]MBT4310707.1 penicillin-binding protein 2 [Anaerolineae bacterium]MBT4457883.1 penicillin-binding protein 2 [Anaerolineae bacterium]MBT4842072.1 penicillin-binding protein 2 [Anaerolineae bacterium]MBT6060295.1 penicillin-binding protein 2 [Anaerolineae bacterium]
MRKEFTWRSLSLASIFAMIGILIIVQMTRIQVSTEAADFREQATRYKGWVETVYPARGEIYDRNGNLLAGNQSVFEVGVTLQNIENAQSIAAILSTVLSVDYIETLTLINNADEDQVYLRVADYVSSVQVEELRRIQGNIEEDNLNNSQEGQDSLAGLNFRRHLARSYPENAIASNIIGFVNQSGRGYFGIEEKYNDLLAGNAVQVWVPADPNRVEEIPHVPDGTTLVLTINRELQASTEQILDQSLYNYGAESGTIIVMDPKNGEILAMASTPRLNLDNYSQYDQIFNSASEYNRAINMPYEPGSVFKILTMAAALDMGIVTPQTTYVDIGSFSINGTVIRNWDQGAWGLQDMTGCLRHSLNVCMAWIATEMGTDNFYDYMSNFGIGHPTGIDLSGEAGGRLKVPGDADWYPIDLATNSFGQGVTTTPIQMLMATSAVANDGKMVAPHILYGMVRNGKQYDFPPQDAGTPISKGAAQALSEMLANSIAGDDSNVAIPGYRLAGKTGTAQIPTEYGWYSEDETNTSYIGWGPVDDPQFMIYVWLEKPTTSIWASKTAAPVFTLVAEESIRLLNIPPDIIRQQYAAGQ